jgi:hypothetical protein
MLGECLWQLAMHVNTPNTPHKQHDRQNILWSNENICLHVQVGPNVWLGRVYVINPVEALAMTPRNPMEAAAMRLSQIQLNTTLMNTFTALGIEGPDAKPYALSAVSSPINPDQLTTDYLLKGKGFPSACVCICGA